RRVHLVRARVRGGGAHGLTLPRRALYDGRIPAAGEATGLRGLGSLEDARARRPRPPLEGGRGARAREDGGGAESRTRVRECSRFASTCVVQCFGFRVWT